MARRGPLPVVLVGASQSVTTVGHALLQQPDLWQVRGLLTWERSRTVGHPWWQRHGLQSPSPEETTLAHRVQARGGQWGTTLTAAWVQHCLPQGGLVLVATWGKRLPGGLLAAVPGVRFMNLHPSLLPAYRGPNPYTAALLDNAAQSGLTLHWMTPRFDDGPIVAQQAVPIHPHDTGGSLKQRCLATVPSLLAVLRAQLAAVDDEVSALAGQPQPAGAGQYVSQAQLEAQLELNWQAPPEALARQVRAHQPWTPCLAYWQGRWPLAISSLVPVTLATPPPGVAPGTLLPHPPAGDNTQQATPPALLVQSACPATALAVTQLALYLPSGTYANPGLSAWVARHCFRPGHVLTSQWQHPWPA